MKIFEGLQELSIIPFFSISYDCIYLHSKKKLNRWDKKYLLPSTSSYLDEEEFAEVYMSWNEESIGINIIVQAPFEKINTTECRRADSVEIFIDTRDIKNQKFLTKYCHHFVVYPKKDPKYYAKEITKFYQDDVHPLCNPEDISVKSKIEPKKYFLEIEIPSFCLYGFDPQRFDRFGFSYRINRYLQYPQNFSASSEEYKIENNPSLWSSINMIKKEKK